MVDNYEHCHLDEEGDTSLDNVTNVTMVEHDYFVLNEQLTGSKYGSVDSGTTATEMVPVGKNNVSPDTDICTQKSPYHEYDVLEESKE